MTIALGWMVLGLAITIGAWRMDRLAHLNIEPWSAPGLVPGVLGVLIAVFGAVLALRERGARVAAGAREPQPAAGTDWRRVLPVLALALVFTVGLLGRGLPFVATSTALVFAWIVIASLPAWRAEGGVGRGLARTAMIAVVACGAIAALFQEVFLVRLP